MRFFQARKISEAIKIFPTAEKYTQKEWKEKKIAHFP